MTRNQAMARKLRSGDCTDVSKCRRTATGDYVLEDFEDGQDYCDVSSESWIWSIGKLLRPLPSVLADGSRETLPVGTFLASTDGRHYNGGESEVIECV